jgi:hypothetical protein
MSASSNDIFEVLGKTTAELIHRLNGPCSRRATNYTAYTVSDAHRERKARWPSILNISRGDWFIHPNYQKNTQMPQYHVHFREEMLLVLKHTHKGLSLLYSHIQDGSEIELPAINK